MIDGKTQEVTAILDSYHSATLLAMARAARLPVPPKGTIPKAKVMAIMKDGFFTRERVAASLASLDHAERSVLNRLLLRGGSAPTSVFEREIVGAGLAVRSEAPERSNAPYTANYVPYASGEHVGNPDVEGSRVFADIIARLTLRGLVFSRFVGDPETWPPFKLQFHPADEVFVPPAILPYLPPPEPAEAVTLAPTTVKQGDPETLLRDLYLYWDSVRRCQVALTKGGLVTKRALRAVNQQLLVPDPSLETAHSESETGRLCLLRQLLMALRLVRPEGGELRATCAALEIPDFWSWPREHQLAACLQAWPSLAGVGEMGQGAAVYEPSYHKARQALLRALQAYPAGVWVDPQELADHMHADDRNCLFPEYSRVQSSRGSWYQSVTNSQYYGPPRVLLQQFDRYRAQFVEACLSGFLFLIGAVELGYEGDRLLAVRLSSLGRALLGAEPGATPATAPPTDTGRVVVQPSFQILAMGPVSLAVLARLDLFADRQRADRGAFEYRLSRESVYRGQQLGVDAAEVITFLIAATGQELPQNVRRSLEEWAAHHERIIFRSGVSLVQAATPELLSEVLAQPETAPFLARRVTPQVALVAKGAVEPLIDALVKRGLFPAVSGPNPRSADHSVTIAEDGTIRPIHTVPSLHLRGRLARLAEESPPGDGTWRLTPTSVHRAAGNKARVLRLLDELGALHRGPLPEWLVERVRAWGGYYGDATAATLTLMEFRDGETLEELRAQPELKDLLIPFAAGDRALAAVPAGRLAEVKAILAGLGVHVRDGLS